MTQANRIRLTVGAALLVPGLLASPALGDGATKCWSYGDTPGLFSWPQSPSTACRDGVFVSGPRPEAASEQTAVDDEQIAPETGKTESETTFTFSGSAYVGIAAQF